MSNSYGFQESAPDSGYDTSYYNHPGVAITVSAGDQGNLDGLLYPAVSPYVTSVGGTSLTSASNSRGWTESGWGGTNYGCSAYEFAPSWQTGLGCGGMRVDNDVAAVADPNTGVAVYDTYDNNGWLEAGGTSVSAPIIAAVYALAGIPNAGTYPSSYLYANSSVFDHPVNVGFGPDYNEPTG